MAASPPVVTLTTAQVVYADQVGDCREDANADRHGRHGAARYDPAASRRVHRDGARCEAAVLAYLAPGLRAAGLVPWQHWRRCEDADPRTIRGDVAGWEVRGTTCWPGGRLIVQPDDANQARFIFVVNRCPDFLLVGWLSGREAKRRQWWKQKVPSPAYFVPAAALHPLPVPAQALLPHPPREPHPHPGQLARVGAHPAGELAQVDPDPVAAALGQRRPLQHDHGKLWAVPAQREPAAMPPAPVGLDGVAHGQ